MADDYPAISWLNAGRLLNRGIDAVPQMINSGIDSGIGALSGMFAPTPAQPLTPAEVIRRRMQAATVPDRMPFGVGSPAEVGLQAPTGLESAIGGAINETATLPKRAMEAAQQSAAQRVSPLNMAEDDPRLDRRFGALAQPPMDPLVPIGVETALTGASMAPVAAVKDAAGIFGGRLAKTADQAALAKAEEMAGKGADRMDIWNDTGWFKGKDDQWRFEIPDHQAKLTYGNTLPTADDINARPNLYQRLQSEMWHRDLTAAYPELKDTGAQVMRGPRPSGEFRSSNQLYDDAGPTVKAVAPTPEEAKPVLLHELQHNVQNIEGHAPGSAPEMFTEPRGETANQIETINSRMSEISREQDAIFHSDAPASERLARQTTINKEYNDLLDERQRLWKEATADPYGQYHRTAGEVEARNVMTRADMTPEQRRAAPPWTTEDVPHDQQIVLKRAGQQASDDVQRSTPAAEAAATDPGTGGGGGVGGLEQAQATAARWAGAKNQLEGLPGALKIGGGHFVPGPIGKVHDVAEDYMRSTGRPYEPPTQYHPLDPEHSTAIAKAFDEMPHTPDDPATKASYKALIDETLGQYQAMKKSGLKVEFIEPGMPDPYAVNPRLAAKDVAENNHLWVYPTDSGFGSAGPQAGAHPMLAPTGETISGKPAVANDIFRAVHDYFGHLKEGHGFRAAGEDNAWRSHAAMYSDIARPAMTTETRGQNSWVNYGPHGAKNRTASAADTVYADQKVGLMPEWTMRDRGSPDPIIAYHGGPNDIPDKFSLDKIGTGEGNQAYGHGLYFAEHEPVASWYRSQLAARRDPLLQKYGLDSEDGANIGMTLASSGGKTEPVIADLQDRIAKLEASGNRTAADRNVMARMQGKLAYLQDPERAVGHQYQVRIKATPDQFLEWDKPLKEQSPFVREKLKPWLDEAVPKMEEARQRILAREQARPRPNPKSIEKWIKPVNPEEFSGQKIYEMTGTPALDKHEGYPKSADALKRMGIPGLRYLDQGSRGGMAGTKNIVAFDDKIVEILRKYGIAGLPAGAGGAATFGAIGRKSEDD